MKPRLLLLLLIAGSLQPVRAQDVMVVEKPGHRPLFYYVSDPVTLIATDSNVRISGRITAISDSSLEINTIGEIPYRKIKAICTRRGLAVFFSSVFATAAVAYFSLDGVNNLINGDRPVVRSSSALISLSGLTAAGLLYLISDKKMRTGAGQYRLKKITRVRYTTP